MIIYFSGTGNSRKVAETLADLTKDTLFDLGAAYKEGNFTIKVTQGCDLGIVFPVYRWSTPRIVDEFFRKVTFETDDGSPFKPGYSYAVDVYGYFPGNEVAHLERLLQQTHGFGFDASYEVASVPNCIYVSNPPNTDKQSAKNAAMEQESIRIAQQILQHSDSVKRNGTPLGRLLSKATGTEEKPRSVKQFKVNREKCTSCGTCARVCPTNTIQMKDGFPVWEGSDCTECLACIHRCPAEAIDYGGITKGRRRYANPVLSDSISVA